jgi:hypothetical protein
MRRKKMEEEPFCDWRLLAEPRRCPTPRPLDPAVPRTSYCVVAPLLRSRLGSSPSADCPGDCKHPAASPPTAPSESTYFVCLATG